MRAVIPCPGRRTFAFGLQRPEQEAGMDSLFSRSGAQCELCRAESELSVFAVDPGEGEDPDKSVLLCSTCRSPVEAGEPLESSHWYCLQEAAWSEVPAVQVLSYRLLSRMSGQTWATDLLDQIYLEEEVLAWAQQGMDGDEAADPKTVDSNGAELRDGDTVTLIKDLNVKGAGFTAKRGTVVKNIRVGNDPTHIEGRVQKMSIMLKTCFLKKVF